MDFDSISRDFNNRKPKGPTIGEIPWFNVKWEDGNSSVNDLIIRELKRLGINDYLRTFGGEIWFIYGGAWTCCTHEVKDDT